MQSALANLDVNRALAELSQGALLKQIAERYGVAKQSLNAKLRQHPHYREAIKAQAESLVEDATAEAMNGPSQMTDIARARLKVETAHKWAAARDPETWGAKQQVAVVVVHVEERISDSAAELLRRIAATQVGHVTELGIEHNARSETVTQDVTHDVVPAQHLPSP